MGDVFLAKQFVRYQTMTFFVRPLPIPHLHDWRKMEVCLINFNKDESDEGCLKFCNILNWSATV
jgi:hypothetical protein